jgi:hypothetical protein
MSSAAPQIKARTEEPEPEAEDNDVGILKSVTVETKEDDSFVAR